LCDVIDITSLTASNVSCAQDTTCQEQAPAPLFCRVDTLFIGLGIFPSFCVCGITNTLLAVSDGDGIQATATLNQQQ